MGSLLSRGAWIEIKRFFYSPLTYQRRSSHEERGLKSTSALKFNTGSGVAPLTRSVDWNILRFISLPDFFSRSSHEERGLKYRIWYPPWMKLQSLLSRGAWIEIARKLCYHVIVFRRSSHEERGLKCNHHIFVYVSRSRSSHEERGLKYQYLYNINSLLCRSSHEERGLKLRMATIFQSAIWSLLSRGAWIEIYWELGGLCK